MIMRATGFTRIAGAVLVAALSISGGMAYAATGASTDEAVAMVKKAVGAIKVEGPAKALSLIHI